ncbi:MAG: hypothetical protein KAX05_09290 [Bacteroidales bacterium]|nr:hypothetical protein [Bacteroidales bacterium]
MNIATNRENAINEKNGKLWQVEAGSIKRGESWQVMAGSGKLILNNAIVE